jgi:hypothetical protein
MATVIWHLDFGAETKTFTLKWPHGLWHVFRGPQRLQRHESMIDNLAIGAPDVM